MAPRRVAEGVDRASFGPDDTLIVRALGERSNTLARLKKDGTDRERIGNYAIIDKGRASPDGEWIIAAVSKSSSGGGETTAIPVSGGTPVAICGQGCPAAWSLDGRFLLITVFGGLNGAGDRVAFGPTVRGRTLAIPVPTGRVLPELPGGLRRSIPAGRARPALESSSGRASLSG